MNNKKTILHIIQNFGRGGAETAVVGVLKNLHEYNNIVVTLDNLNEFGNELKYDKLYCLNLDVYYLFPMAIKKLRKIIIDNKVDLVHSQLYWSTVLARFACPKNIPLVTSIQASLSDSLEYKKKWICWLDKYSYKKRKSTILGVSNHTLEDYFSFLGLKKHEAYTLYNFVDTSTFSAMAPRQYEAGGEFKLIAVGNLKGQKNHVYLLEAFKQLKGENISLDIYGEGMLREELTSIINEHKLPVRLMGKISNLQEVIGNYDLFVLSSLYEGFSLAVLEGMVMGKPMLLSGIPTFTEQCADTATYFSLSNVHDLVEKIRFLHNNPAVAVSLATKGQARALQHFTLQHHLQELRKIYNRELNAVNKH